MRKLKKTLAIALVLVMALGMIPTAFALTTSADYGDADDITYKEQVDVLSAIRVMEGIDSEDGGRHFSPDREVNRAEAAAIVARLVLGRRVADSLPPTGTKFPDVPSSHWASGYIGWCIAQGIVEGYPNGNFGPRNNVTAAQFAAMLLRAIGYGRNGEYVGAIWQTNAVVDGMREGILEGDVNFSAAANREQTALYAFNALFAPMVVYSKDTESYKTIDAPNTIRTRTYRNPDLYYLTAAGGETDAFKRPAKTWMLGEDAIGSYVSTAILKFNNTVTVRDIFRGIGLAANYDDDADVYVDGEPVAAVPIFNEAAGGPGIANTGRGVQTEVFYNRETKLVTIVIINTFLAQVVGVTDADDEDPRSIDLEVFGTLTSLNSPWDIEGYVTDDFDEDDWVILYLTNSYDDASNVEYIVPAPSFVDQAISSYSESSNNVTWGGTTYRYAANYDDASFTKNSFDFEPATYNFYMDEFNNILGNEQFSLADTPLDYAYVSDFYFSAGTGGGLSTTAYNAKVELIFLDGTSKVYDLAVSTAGSTAVKYITDVDSQQGDLFINIPDAAGAAVRYLVARKSLTGTDAYNIDQLDEDYWKTLQNRLVSFEIDDAGKVSLSHKVVMPLGNRTITAVLLPDADNIVFEASTPTVGGITGAFANSSTTLVTVGDAVTTYEGFAKFPSWDFDKTTPKTKAPVVYVKTNTTLNNILVIGEEFEAPAAPDGYAIWTGGLRSIAGGNSEHQLFVNGTAAWYRLDGGVTEPAERTAYEFGLNESNGRGTLKSDTGLAIDDAVTVRRVDASGFMVVYVGTDPDYASEMFASDVAVYNVTGSFGAGGWAKTTTSGIRAGDKVVYFTDGASTPKITAIFILERPA